MANFAESAPRAHLVYGRSAAWTWASSQVRPQQLFSLFCVFAAPDMSRTSLP